MLGQKVDIGTSNSGMSKLQCENFNADLEIKENVSIANKSSPPNSVDDEYDDQDYSSNQLKYSRVQEPKLI